MEFFQAKSIRQTALRTAAEAIEAATVAGPTDAAQKAAMEKQIDAWKKTAARYDSEPEAAERQGRRHARADGSRY